MGKGVISPWSKEAQAIAEAPAEVRRPVSAQPSNLQPGPPPDFVPVVFAGRFFSIVVRVPVPKRTSPTVEMGKAALGVALTDLFHRVKLAEKYLAAQSITREPPLGPKVTLTLGGLTLYAKAGSLDADLALKMAVDRLGQALLECRAWHKETQAILSNFGVDVARKT